MLNRFFKLKEHQTSIKTEVLAAFTTFLTMSYIIFVNPSILSLTGMDQGAVFVATCLAAAMGSALMGLLANYPIALAPGMGLNAYFTYSVVLGSGYSWQIGLGAVFVSGFIFLCITLSPLRNYIINSIPTTLKVSIVAGLGLFLFLIGCKNAGLVVANPATLIALGNLHQPTTLLAIAGFFLMIGLENRGILGSIIISILTITVLSIILGYQSFHGLFSMPPSLLPTLFKMDIQGALDVGLITIVFAFLFVDFFDNAGTLIGIAYRAGLVDRSGKLPRIGKALLASSLAAMLGAMLGTSTTTSYVESTVGVKVGGRTGLTSVVIAILFLLATFFSPLAQSIPLYATAPALIYVACLMIKAVTEIDWDDATEYVPGIITFLSMPLTFSVSEGISFGFISYTVIKLMSDKRSEISLPLILLSIAFALKYYFFQHSL